MVSFCTATLSQVNDSVKVPQYDRSKIKAGIFHFGVGGFHRAHQARIMDDLFNIGLAHNWGICGIGVMHGVVRTDSKMKNVMRDQNCLYTLVEKESNGKENLRVIGSIVEYLYVPDDFETVIERIASEAKIVSLTITEAGYHTNPTTGGFDLDQTDVKDPRHPKSVYGIVTEALRLRRERGLGGLTIMSCDNFRDNGPISQKTFVAYAKSVDKSLGDWVLKNVSFPSSMVDRITPQTTAEDRIAISKLLGVIDAWPVVCEPFIQWVLEDNFVAGRPPFENSVVQLVSDVKPYELMKLRLINASHQAITYFGVLMNYSYIHTVSQDETVARFLKAYMDKEVTQTLKPLPGFDLENYKEMIVKRFQNPNLKDSLLRLSVHGSDRVPRLILPIIKDLIKADQSIWFCTAIIASFMRYLGRFDDYGTEIVYGLAEIDQNLDRIAQKLKKDSNALRGETECFGELANHEKFTQTFKEIYEKLSECGSKRTLEWLLETK